MKLLFSSFRNFKPFSKVCFSKEDILKPNEAELEIDSRFEEKVGSIVKFMPPDSLKGNIDDVSKQILDKLPGKITKKKKAEEIKKAIAESRPVQEVFLSEDIKKSQEFLQNEKNRLVFVENGALFDKNISRDPYKSFLEEARKVFAEKCGKEKFDDKEWEIISSKLSEDFERFYKQTQKEHMHYSLDEKSIDREVQVLKTRVNTEKAGEDLWKKSFSSEADLLAWWKIQPDIAEQLESSKGKRKELLEKKLKELISQEFLNYQEKNLHYSADSKSLDKEKTILENLLQPKKLPKTFWRKNYKTVEDLSNAWLEASPQLAERLANAQGLRKELLKDFFEKKMEKEFQMNIDEQQKRVDRKIQTSRDIFEAAEKKFSTSEYEKMSSDEIESLIQAQLKSEKLFDSLPPDSEERKELYSFIEESWKKSSEKIEAQKEKNALEKINQLDTKLVDFSDQRNEDFSFFVKNFSEIFFDDATWKKVSKTAYVKFEKLHKEYLKNLSENTDAIPRKEMGEKWEKFLGKMNSYSMDFNSFDDFKNQFMKTSFDGKKSAVDSYFKAHPNFSKAFQKSFETYQIKQKEHMESQFSSVVRGISDSQIRKGMEESFTHAKDMKTRREWFAYAKKRAPEYESSLRKTRQQERALVSAQANIKGNPEAQKILETFEQKKTAFESSKGIYVQGRFVSPRTYEAELAELEKELETVKSQEKKEQKEAESTIKKITSADLDSSKTYKNFSEFKRQPFLETTVSFSDHIWEKVQPNFESHMARLWAEQLKIQNGDEKIPENSDVSKARKDIQDLSLKDLDTETKWTSFEDFKRQPFLQKNISYPDDIWNSINESHFQPKMAELYAEYLETSKEDSEANEWKSEIENMGIGDVSDIDDPKFLDKGLLAKEFSVFMPDDVWEKEGKKLFSKKLDEIHTEISEHQKNPENSEDSEFGKDDIRAMGSRHGLNFHNITLRNSKNLRKKFERLEEMIKKSDSFKRMLRGNESEMIPFFVGFFGEMNDSEMRKTLTDMGSGYRTFDDLSEKIFDNDRRRYLANKARKENFHSWDRLSQGEKRMKTSKISDILLQKEGLQKEIESVEPLDIELIEDDVLSHELDEAEVLVEKEALDISENELEKSQEFFKEDLSSEDEEEIEDDLDDTEEESDETDTTDVLKTDIDEDSSEELIEEEVLKEDSEENDEVVESDEEVDQKIPEKISAEKSEELEEETEEDIQRNAKKIPEISEEDSEAVQEEEQKDPHIFWEQYAENGMRVGDILEKVETYGVLVWKRNIPIFKKIPEKILNARVPDSEGFFSEIIEYILSQKIQDIVSVEFVYGRDQMVCMIQKSFGMARKNIAVVFEE